MISSPSVFVYLLIAHVLRLSLSIYVKLYWDRVDIAIECMCMFLNFSGVEIVTGRKGLYFLDGFNVVTGRMC